MSEEIRISIEKPPVGLLRLLPPHAMIEPLNQIIGHILLKEKMSQESWASHQESLDRERERRFEAELADTERTSRAYENERDETRRELANARKEIETLAVQLQEAESKADSLAGVLEDRDRVIHGTKQLADWDKNGSAYLYLTAIAEIRKLWMATFGKSNEHLPTCRLLDNMVAFCHVTGLIKNKECDCGYDSSAIILNEVYGLGWNYDRSR